MPTPRNIPPPAPATCAPRPRALAALLMGALLATPAVARATSDAPRFVSNNGQQIQLTLAAQLQADLGGQGDLDTSTTSVRLRRLRPGLTYTSSDGSAAMRVLLNTSPNALEVLDVWGQWRLSEGLALRAGQLKVPLLGYRQGSVHALRFVDWSPVTAYLGGERQVGVVLRHERRGAERDLHAQLGVFHGQNARRSHGVGPALLTGSARVHPSALVDGPPLGAPHPEAVGMLRYTTHPEDGRWGATLTASAAYDVRPTLGQDWRWRAGLEAQLQHNTLELLALASVGALDPDAEGHATAPSLWAVMLEAGWHPTPRWAFATRVTTLATTAHARDLLQADPASPDPIHTLAELGLAANLYARHNTMRVALDASQQHAQHEHEHIITRQLRLMLQLEL